VLSGLCCGRCPRPARGKRGRDPAGRVGDQQHDGVVGGHLGDPADQAVGVDHGHVPGDALARPGVDRDRQLEVRARAGHHRGPDGPAAAASGHDERAPQAPVLAEHVGIRPLLGSQPGHLGLQAAVAVAQAAQLGDLAAQGGGRAHDRAGPPLEGAEDGDGQALQAVDGAAVGLAEVDRDAHDRRGQQRGKDGQLASARVLVHLLREAPGLPTSMVSVGL